MSETINTLVGATIALTGFFVNDHLRHRRQKEKDKRSIEEELEGMKFYVKNINYYALHSFIQGRYFSQLEATSRFYKNTSEQTREQWRAEANFWRQQHDLKQSEQVKAVRDLQKLLVRNQYIYNENTRIIEACKKLIETELPETTELKPANLADLEKWKETNLGYLDAYLLVAWDEPIEELLNLMRTERNKPRDLSSGTDPEPYMLSFIRWLRRP